MNKFEKGILITSLISLALTVIFGSITIIVGLNSAVKFLANDGVKSITELMEYGTKKLDEFTGDGNIVINKGDDDNQVTIDFNDGIHVQTGHETVNIDRTGIHVDTPNENVDVGLGGIEVSTND